MATITTRHLLLLRATVPLTVQLSGTMLVRKLVIVEVVDFMVQQNVRDLLVETRNHVGNQVKNQWWTRDNHQ